VKTQQTGKYSCRLRPAKLKDRLGLLDYGFLRRSPHPTGVTVSLAEKALWVLSLGEGKE